MTRLTKAQRRALLRVYERVALYDVSRLESLLDGRLDAVISAAGIDAARLSYRDFRKLVRPTFDDSGAIMVPWCGIWLGIETDGYTHS